MQLFMYIYYTGSSRLMCETKVIYLCQSAEDEVELRSVDMGLLMTSSSSCSIVP